jgi:hypothetical protein
MPFTLEKSRKVREFLFVCFGERATFGQEMNSYRFFLSTKAPVRFFQQQRVSQVITTDFDIVQ